MPISQQRMIALIHAARDYQDALEKACAYIARASSAIKAGRSTAQAEMEYLPLYIQDTGLLRDPINSPKAIAVEEAHFKRNAGRNAAAARNAERKRRESGVKPQQPTVYETMSNRHVELEPVPWSTSPQQIAHPTSYADTSADGMAEAEITGTPVPALPSSGRKFLNTHGQPVRVIGDPNAPGLYDSDDDETDKAAPIAAIDPLDNLSADDLQPPPPQAQANIDAYIAECEKQEAVVEQRLKEMEKAPDTGTE